VGEVRAPKIGHIAKEILGSYCSDMSCGTKPYLIRFKCSDLGPHLVMAASAEIHGEHLVSLRSDGSLAALFVLEVVESWPEVEPFGASDMRFSIADESYEVFDRSFPPRAVPPENI
jgi:hypothetical protein